LAVSHFELTFDDAAFRTAGHSHACGSGPAVISLEIRMISGTRALPR
jgi:hypothetical protein